MCYVKHLYAALSKIYDDLERSPKTAAPLVLKDLNPDTKHRIGLLTQRLNETNNKVHNVKNE